MLRQRDPTDGLGLSLSQFSNALCARRRGQQQRTSGVREVVLHQVGVRASCRSRMPVTGCADDLTWPMLVTESGIVTLVRLVHWLKAFCETQSARARVADRRASASERVWRGAAECARGELTWPMLVTESFDYRGKAIGCGLKK